MLVGHVAKERRLNDAFTRFTSVKRLIGRSWTLILKCKRRGYRFPFKLKEGPKFGTLVTARG